MIAATLTQPELSGKALPGIRFGLIEFALAPFVESTSPEHPAHLRRDLSVVMSAESLFSLTDLCGVSVEDAIDSAERTATTLTAAAFRRHDEGPIAQPTHL